MFTNILYIFQIHGINTRFNYKIQLFTYLTREITKGFIESENNFPNSSDIKESRVKLP